MLTTPIDVITSPTIFKSERIFTRLNSHLVDLVWREEINGEKLDRTRLISDGHLRANAHYSHKQLGTVLTHAQIWREVLVSQQAHTIVNENTVLHPDFLEKSQELVTRCNNDWDLIYWGFNSDSSVMIQNFNHPLGIDAIFNLPAKIQVSQKSFGEPHVVHQLFPILHVFGTHSYSISPRGAEFFLKNVFPLSGRSVSIKTDSKSSLISSIDGEMNLLYPRTKTFMAFPPLSIEHNL